MTISTSHWDYAAHISHCDQGEYEGVCKYGDDAECPALAIAALESDPSAIDRMSESEMDRVLTALGVDIEAIAAAAELLRSAGWTCKPPDPAAAYFDNSFPERACDYCRRPYRGPALYCCLAHAVADA